MSPTSRSGNCASSSPLCVRRVHGIKAALERSSSAGSSRRARLGRWCRRKRSARSPASKRRTAEVIIAETGGDMTAFPTAKHLASWAGVCPGNDESAGKRRSGKTRKGSKWLRANLIEAATAASRTKDTYLQAQYQRLRARRGHARAITALAHSMLVATWHILTTGEIYRDPGGDYFTKRDPERQTRRLVAHLEKLGHVVTLQPATSTAPSAVAT